MSLKLAAFLGLLLSAFLACAQAGAQQTGVLVGRTPGSAVGKVLPSTQTPIPRTTCESAGTPGLEPNGSLLLPDLIFSRDDLVCLRHTDGRTEELTRNLPWGGELATKTDFAYWLPDKHELHVFSIAARKDTVIDTLPGAKLAGVVWSGSGRTLAYLPLGANPPGIRTFDLDTGARKIIAGDFVAIARTYNAIFASSDAGYIGATSHAGIERVNLSTGQHELLVPALYLDDVAYSPAGNFLGIKSNEPSGLLAVPPDKWPKKPTATQDDDEPDCGGGAFYLIVWNVATKRLTDVPFPKGFDSVLDFEFSPDGHALAVTFGSSSSCDYPGDAAQVFLVSLPDLKLTPLSPADQLSAQAHWSPDGKVVVYGVFANPPTALMAVDVRTGKAIMLTRREINGPDSWLGWR